MEKDLIVTMGDGVRIRLACDFDPPSGNNHMYQQAQERVKNAVLAIMEDRELFNSPSERIRIAKVEEVASYRV